ncbi:type IV secretion system DNA-binding domain-containing protein [Streptomyces sp. NPDC050315]|uniref:type IV secretory system conjugative DNA transfer family protein n=1 Tax=Streptomyces sp. NPDC050315 TaxID=3155039 RepID=UPI003412437B
MVDFLLDPLGTLTAIGHTAWPVVRTWLPLLATFPAIPPVRACLRRWRSVRMARGAQCITIAAPPDVDPRGAEALWANLAGLARPWWRRPAGGQPHLAFEYAFDTDGCHIRLWLPGSVPHAMISRAIEAAWPGSHTRITAPPPPPLRTTSTHATTAGTLRLARPDVLPIEADHPADPLRALLAAGTALVGGEQLLIQILARPALGGRVRRGYRAARRFKAGRSASRALALLDWLTHRPAPGTAQRYDARHAAEQRAIAAKLAGPLWETGIRYLATAPAKLPGARSRTRGRAHAAASAFALYAGRNWYARHRFLRPLPRLTRRAFPPRGDLLSVPELAALAHLPHDPTAPGITRAGARSITPPVTVPGPGPDAKPLGAADTGPRRPIAISVPDARHHLHIIGATGSGKSTLMGNLVLDDVQAHRGAVVIDPKGDLTTDLLARLPAEFAERVVLLDPDDAAAPPCLNVLEGDATEVVVDNLVGIFRRIFSAFWGPRTDDVMRAACLTLLHHGAATRTTVTLADVPALLVDEPTRNLITAGLNDPVLKGFWSWYSTLSEPSRAAAIGPLMNKLRAFLLRDFVRKAIAAGPSTFDLTHVLDGGLCLVRLPKGVLGEETARLLGSFVVAKTWQAAAARVRTTESARVEAALYIDECHNFLTLPYPLEDMLAEARAYRLSLVLAHQNLAQLPTDLREGISANARSKLIFNASPEDARALERHTFPALTAHDLSHLSAYQAAARLVVNAADSPAFTLTTTPLPEPIRGRATEIRRRARAIHTRHQRPTTAPTTGLPADPRSHT